MVLLVTVMEQQKTFTVIKPQLFSNFCFLYSSLIPFLRLKLSGVAVGDTIYKGAQWCKALQRAGN